MKIAVILTEFLKSYVKSYFDSHAQSCELDYFIYQNFTHAGELYIQLENEYDGFLVSGPVPRAAICRRVPFLKKPIVSFGSNALCYYETFFQIQYKEQDFFLKHGYFDLLEWHHGIEQNELHRYLEEGQFSQVLYQVYQNTSSYSLEQLCAMEEAIKEKHIRLWTEKKIRYSVTRFSNIMPDLIRAGVKTYFVYPKQEILQESLTLLLQDIHLKSLLQNQTAITTLSQHFSDGASVSFPDLSGQKELTSHEEFQISRFAQKTGFSTSYIRRLFSALTTLDQEHITSQSLSAALEITPRSANRLFTRLLECGAAEIIAEKQGASRGRPEKIYRIHWDS